jgi:hypothetical protein
MTRSLLSSFGLLAVLTICFIPSASRAQQDQTPPPEPSKSSYGVVLDGALNLQHSNFQELPGVPNCCPLFQNGSGLGGSFGLFYDYDAFGDGLLGVRAVWSLLGGKLSTTETVLVDVADGNALNLPLLYTLNSHFSVAELQPYYKWTTGNFGLMVGPTIGSVIGSTFDQSETIQGNQGVFVGGCRSRNIYSGNIPEAQKLWFSVFGGVSYSLPLNHSGSLHLLPEIVYDQGLTQMVSGLTWNISALRAGVSIAYTPIHYFEPPPPPAPPPPPPPPPVKPALIASIKAYSISNGVKDSTNLSVRVEEFYTSTTTPLLPFIFFGLDDAQIPARYHRLTPEQAATFDISKTDSTDNVHVYHDALNIIGQRMHAHPSAKLTLTGCTSNDPQELADRNLANERAGAVAVYLERVWNITPDRLKIETKGLPGKPSSLTTDDGKEENRRVEITANDPSILGVETLGDTDLSTNPPVMEFVPTVQAQAGVKFWDLYVTQSVLIVHHEFGKGTQPKAWNWDLHAACAHRLCRTAADGDWNHSRSSGYDQQETAGARCRSGDRPLHAGAIRFRFFENRPAKRAGHRIYQEADYAGNPRRNHRLCRSQRRGSL